MTIQTLKEMLAILIENAREAGEAWDRAGFDESYASACDDRVEQARSAIVKAFEQHDSQKS